MGNETLGAPQAITESEGERFPARFAISAADVFERLTWNEGEIHWIRKKSAPINLTRACCQAKISLEYNRTRTSGIGVKNQYVTNLKKRGREYVLVVECVGRSKRPAVCQSHATYKATLPHIDISALKAALEKQGQTIPDAPLLAPLPDKEEKKAKKPKKIAKPQSQQAPMSSLMKTSLVSAQQQQQPQAVQQPVQQPQPVQQAPQAVATVAQAAAQQQQQAQQEAQQAAFEGFSNIAGHGADAAAQAKSAAEKKAKETSVPCAAKMAARGGGTSAPGSSSGAVDACGFGIDEHSLSLYLEVLKVESLVFNRVKQNVDCKHEPLSRYHKLTEEERKDIATSSMLTVKQKQSLAEENGLGKSYITKLLAGKDGGGEPGGKGGGGGFKGAASLEGQMQEFIHEVLTEMKWHVFVPQKAWGDLRKLWKDRLVELGGKQGEHADLQQYIKHQLPSGLFPSFEKSKHLTRQVSDRLSSDEQRSEPLTGPSASRGARSAPCRKRAARPAGPAGGPGGIGGASSSSAATALAGGGDVSAFRKKQKVSQVKHVIQE